MSDVTAKKVLFEPIFNKNPIALQILGICSALAVTSQLSVTLVMAISVTAGDGLFQLRDFPDPHADTQQYPDHCADDHHCLAGHRGRSDPARPMPTSISKQLSVFVGLIITNCIVMGRAEGVRHEERPGAELSRWHRQRSGLQRHAGGRWPSVRELLGSGKLLGYTILPVVKDGGWYQPNGLLLLPPSAFFMIGLFIWGLRTWKTGPGGSAGIQAAAHKVKEAF